MRNPLKKTPKGMHMMPNGELMMNSMMKPPMKPPTKKIGKPQKGKKGY